MNKYVMKLRTYNVLPGGVKHSGFWFEEYDADGNFVKATSLELSISGFDSFFKILTINDVNEFNIIVNNGFNSFYDRLESDTVEGNKSILDAFSKIKLEMAVINKFSNQLNYLLVENNCNAAIEYLAGKYILGYENNGMGIFDGVGGFIIDGWFDFGKQDAVKKAAEIVDNLVGAGIWDINLDNLQLDNSNSTYAIIGDGVSSYKVYKGGTGRTITGTAGDDRIIGGSGSDKMSGKGGVDYLYGGIGNDYLYGNGGNIFNITNTNFNCL